MSPYSEQEIWKLRILILTFLGLGLLPRLGFCFRMKLKWLLLLSLLLLPLLTITVAPHLLSTFFGTIRLMCSAGTSSCLLSSSFVMISLREATSDSCKELRTSAGNSTSGFLDMAAGPSHALLFYRSQNSIHKQFSATRLVLGTLAMTPAIGEKLKRGEQPPAHSLLQTSALNV